MINSVYIHIPFCEDICSYCDFCKIYYNEAVARKYLDTLEKEIKENYKNEIINTIYIGGGTPSALSLNNLKKLLEITKIFNKEDVEFTFECNIENIDEDKIKLLKKYGVNRISVGVQTFNLDLLLFLNRHHKEKEVFEKIDMIKKYFDNINVDLIYAIPKQNIKDLEKDIDSFLKLGINHISTYSLIIEPNTIISSLRIMPIDDSLDYDMYKLICSKLKSNGFNHYEVSNFSKKGYESRHNLVYWNNEHYYGFGAGASGYIGDIRYTNTKSVKNYIDGKFNREEEKLTLNQTIENEFILGFRKIDGIDIDKFYNKYNIDINRIDIVNKLLKEGKLELVNRNLRIKEEYIYVSNDILVEFMEVDYGKYI